MRVPAIVLVAGMGSDVVRGVVGGHLVNTEREGKERIEKRTGIPIEELRVSGGGSQSDVAMQITTTARHCELDPDTRDFVEHRLGKFQKYARDIQEVHLIVTAEKKAGFRLRRLSPGLHPTKGRLRLRPRQRRADVHRRQLDTLRPG